MTFDRKIAPRELRRRKFQSDIQNYSILLDRMLFIHLLRIELVFRSDYLCTTDEESVCFLKFLNLDLHSIFSSAIDAKLLSPSRLFIYDLQSKDN